MDGDALAISGLQHFAFCRRQWALIHIEQQWQDNARTVDGELMHHRAHDEASIEKRGDMIIMRGLRVQSREMNAAGVCDVVEFRRDEQGIALAGYEGKWLPYPVEYKRGQPKEHDADELQLCAQAMCLEEMLLCSIPEGSLYYGENHGNILLRKEQYRRSDSREESLRIAQSSIFGKLYNSRWVLERTLRDHGMRVNEEKIRRVSHQIQEQLDAVLQCKDLDMLRGIEGEASARYFGAFDELILNQKEHFSFTERSRRPPADPVNAMLSFAYVLLANDCAAALESVGLDAYAGFMHRDRPGRKSLALDLMEELRAPFADRLVLTLINTKEIQPKHFRRQGSGAVLLTDDGRKILLQAWQSKKRDSITHPYLKEKLPWGLTPYVQALLLARYLRGDLDGYPPFLWK